MDIELIDHLFEVAKASDLIHRVRCVAAISHKKLPEPIIAFNALKTHPFQMRFARNAESIFLHAETNVIRQALRHLSVDDLPKASLYVVRAKINPRTKRWENGLACPCRGCQKAIATFGIENVVYTLDGAGLECL